MYGVSPSFRSYWNFSCLHGACRVNVVEHFGSAMFVLAVAARRRSSQSHNQHPKPETLNPKPHLVGLGFGGSGFGVVAVASTQVHRAPQTQLRPRALGFRV